MASNRRRLKKQTQTSPNLNSQSATRSQTASHFPTRAKFVFKSLLARSSLKSLIFKSLLCCLAAGCVFVALNRRTVQLRFALVDKSRSLQNSEQILFEVSLNLRTNQGAIYKTIVDETSSDDSASEDFSPKGVKSRCRNSCCQEEDASNASRKALARRAASVPCVSTRDNFAVAQFFGYLKLVGADFLLPLELISEGLSNKQNGAESAFSFCATSRTWTAQFAASCAQLVFEGSTNDESSISIELRNVETFGAENMTANCVVEERLKVLAAKSHSSESEFDCFSPSSSRDSRKTLLGKLIVLEFRIEVLRNPSAAKNIFQVKQKP